MKNRYTSILLSIGILSFIALGHSKLNAQTYPSPGFTLPNGKTIIITYEVDVNVDACPDGTVPSANISNQSNVSGSNFTTVLTDDPDIAGLSNPTLTTFGALALGNLVYKDNNNNSVFDGGDVGISGVLLRLYLDNGDGELTVADGAALTTSTTVAGGLYLFNPICPGDYIVEVAASNFNMGGALYDNGLMSPLLSSPVGGAADPDNDVNNDDNGDPVAGFGVATQAITVGYGAEPTTDGDALSNTNLSLDFGFREPTTISIDDVTMNEGTGGSTTSFNFTVTRSNSEAAFSLTVNTNDGTAMESALDYTGIVNGTIMFTEGGSLTQTVTVLVNHDNIVEIGETFTVLITSPPAGTIITDGSGLGTITNDDAANVTLSGGTSQSEGTSFDFTATLNNPVQDGFNVLYTTNDGTALTSDNDYTDNDGPALIFAGTAGESHTITVNSTTDNKVELNEMFTVALNALTGAPTAVTIIGSSQSGTITNDDAAVVAIAGNVSQSEATSPQVFSVTLSNPVDVNVTVQFSTSNGSATTTDNDYVAVAGQIVTFNAGSTTTQTVNVAIIPDMKVETNEMYNVAIGTLGAGAPVRNVTLGTSTGTGTIVNDDSAVLTLGGATSLNEGNTGTTPFVFTVSINNAVQGGFTVSYSTNNNTATVADNDYVDNDNAIIFTGTAGESHMITVQVNGDLNIENNETFDVAVTDVSDVPIPGTVTIAGSPQTGTILNDELDWGDAPTAAQSGFAGTYPTLSADNGARHELFPGDIHLGATVDADLDGQPNGTATGDGTDDDGVTFPAAIVINTTANITVNSSLNGYLNAWADFNRDGDWSDPGEQIFSSTALVAGNNNLSFAVPAAATLGNSFMRFRVSQNPDTNGPFGLSLNRGEVEDYAVNIVDTQFSIDDPSMAEGNVSTSNLVFTITRTNNANNCSVDYTITGGTATTADLDYQPLAAGTASFTSGGSLTQQVIVVVNGDLKVELNESVDITLSNPLNASILDGNGTGMINNDDAAVISITSPSMNEGDAGTQNMVFDITMSKTSDANVSFNYASSDGSATEPADYTNTSGSHTLSPGQTMKQVSVPIVGDCVIETNQAFNLILSSLNPLGRNVTFINGNPTLTGVGTINNEDFPPVITCPNNITISCDESTLAAHTGMATASDDCSPSPTVSSTDVVTPGICATSYTITRKWKATDGTTDMSTCNQIITVVDNPPIAVCKSITIALDNNGNASITPANVNDGSHDVCGSVTLVSVSPNSFNCSHIGQNIVTLTVMDQCGNTATCTSTVTITGGPLYKYVIAAKNGSKLEKNNIVHTGGVGVTALTGKAEIKTFSIVAGSGTFVQAKYITVDITSIVTTKIFTPAVIPLPAFLYNTLSTYNSPSVNVPDNVTQVIAGSVFKNIKVGRNATAIFTNQNIYAFEFETKENATIKFTHCAKVRVKETKFSKNLNFNPDAFDVWLYAEEVEDGIKEGSDIIASIYSLDELKVYGKLYNRSSLTGIFIGKRVDGYEGVDWYANTQCNNGCSIPILPAMAGSEEHNIPISSNEEPTQLKIFPNPFDNDFNITLSSPNVQTMNVRIFDISGKLVSESLKVEPNQVFTTGSQLNPGVYFIEVTQGDYRKVMNLIKLK